MDARREVEVVQAESEATRDEPLPEDVRRGRSVVQSVRLDAGRAGRRAGNLAARCNRAPGR